MKSTHLISGGAPVLALLLLAGCAGTPVGPGSPAAFPTRDVKTVDLTTGTATFIVSLNDDDDNANQVPDLREALAPATEDNIRELVFHHPTADAVYVADIVDLTTHQSVVGVKVRAYEADLHTPFNFNGLHPTSVAHPLKLCLEGIKVSGRKEEFGFEYSYYLNGQPLPAGGFVVGTVVNVGAKLEIAAGQGTNFERKRKMLISAQGLATATVVPDGAGTLEWFYDVPANMTFGAPAAKKTSFTAKTAVTAVLDHDELRFKVNATGHWIEAHFPVNITAPRHTEITNHHRGFSHPTGWLDANQGAFTPVPVYRIDYRLLDQFRKPIRESAYGTRIPQTRENIGRVMTSPIASVQAWITTGLHWSPTWVDHADGTFTDHIEAANVPKDMVVVQFPGNPGRWMFDASLQTKGAVLIQLTTPHVWELSVNGEYIAAGTANTFSSTVTDTRPHGGGTEIELTSTYRANPQ